MIFLLTENMACKMKNKKSDILKRKCYKSRTIQLEMHNEKTQYNKLCEIMVYIKRKGS